MNILIVDHYAGSYDLGMEYRPFYFAREWVKNGHNVSIIGASFSHLRSTQPKINGELTREEIDGVKYFWIKTPAYSGNSVKRVINIMSFNFKLWNRARLFVKETRPDAVIASSTYPFDNIPVNRIARKAKARHIFEIHDLWPLTPMELGSYSKFNPFVVLTQIAENYGYRRCDKVVSILPKTLEHTVSHGLKPEKWNYVPNGINISDWSNSAPVPKECEILIDDLKQKGNTLIAYTGAHGVANALESFVEAAGLMRDQKVAFLLVGTGSEKENLERKASLMNLKNVYFLKPIPKNSIPEFLEKMDILYIGLQKQPLFRFGISPNKLIDYMMAAKPIIQAIEAGNDMVSDAQCGISIEPENPGEIRDAIIKITELSDQDKINMGKNGKNYVINNHEYTILAKEFLKVIS
jgi:glycosyltransferase involved in cell wall biosynthesis